MDWVVEGMLVGGFTVIIVAVIYGLRRDSDARRYTLGGDAE